MSTDEILLQVVNRLDSAVSEIKALRADFQLNNYVTTCNAKDALKMLGLNDSGHLTRFHAQGLLHRQGGGKGGYLYYKSEVLVLAEKIRTGVVIPKLR